MPLELRRQRDGRLRPFWYARYELNGIRHAINLNVKIKGEPHVSGSLSELGDAEFEGSRATAQAKLEGIVAEARSKRSAEALVERLYEIKTGESIKSVKLSGLAEEWGKIARRRTPNARYASQCQSTLRRFAEFVRTHNGKATELAHVTRTAGRAFLDAEAERGVTGKTWNDTLKLLRATFRYLLPAGAINPFADTPTRETDTVFRIPFTPEELAAITEIAKGDEFIRPIIVAGMCTAMRRGDCCLLEWKDVDLANRFITVKTSKTGQTVSIPIFPMLAEELRGKAETLKSEMLKAGQGGGEGQQSSGRDARNDRRIACATQPEGYVFPEQARMYLENPDGITWRVKQVLAGALASAEQGAGSAESTLPVVAEEEVRQRGLEWIAALPDGEKKERMWSVFEHYMTGKNIGQVMAAAGVSKGTVSGYLNEIEKAIGCKVIRGKAGSREQGAKIKARLQVKRGSGLRKASVRDFHSFRVTWVTLALTAGVPLELVQKVTGHKTTDIVLKHYFQPGREAFRAALSKAMPALLMNGDKGKAEMGKAESRNEEQGAKASGQLSVASGQWEKAKTEMREILAKMTGKTWKADKARLLKMLKAA